MCMTLISSSQSPKKVKTPTHILLYSDIKESSMQILKKKGISLSGFLESKLEELIIQSKDTSIKKPMKIVQLKKLPNSIALTQAEQADIYDRDLTPETNPDDKTSIQLSFGQRRRNDWL